jgi:hypothetical protein
MTPAFQVRLGAEWDPVARLGIEVLAFVPVTVSTVAATEGSIALRLFGIGGGLRGLLTDPASDFAVAIGLGAQAGMLSFSGNAQAPWVGNSGSYWAAEPYLSVTAGYRVHPRVSLRLDVLAELVRPEPVLRIAGTPVATFGQPAFLPSLGVEVRP